MFGFSRSRRNVPPTVAKSANDSVLAGLDAERGGQKKVLPELAQIMRAAATPATGSARAAGASGVAVETKAPAHAPLKLISDVKMLPVGRYESWAALKFPVQFRDIAALVRTGPAEGVVLVVREAYGGAAHMELLQRLRALGLRAGTLVTMCCTAEVLRSLHKANANADVALMDDTEVEVAAWALIERAVKAKASDLHIETRGPYAQVFFRIFNERVEQETISTETATAIANVLYSVHADASNKGISWSKDEVKDTSIERVMTDGGALQIRFHSAPIHPSGSFQVVCRLLVMDGQAAKPLSEIGYTDAQERVLEDMIVGAQGLVLLVGPTNSGKSTSMQSIARRIRDRRGKNMKLVTVEDPVEYIIPGACQMGVPHGRRQLEGDSGNIYNTLIKATLREDPDAVIVGEVRDATAADAVKNLVLAGRKIISTLHVFEAMAVFSRLRELGVPESVLFMPNFISGVIYQRLVPVLCPHCSIKFQDAFGRGLVEQAVFDRVSHVLDLHASNVRVRSPGGCDQCGHMGIVGRTICSEILQPDATFLDLMRRGETAAARNQWMQNPELNINGWGISAVAHGISKIAAGSVDPADIESQIGLIRTDQLQGVSAMPMGPGAAALFPGYAGAPGGNSLIGIYS